MRAWHALEPSAIEQTLDSRPTGLGDREAAERLRLFGPNDVPEPPAHSDVAILLRQVRSPLLLVLAAALGVSLLVGEPADAAVIAAVVALDAAIGFVQERHAERAVRALRKLLTPRARVLRDGHVRDIEARGIVRGDLVLLESGDGVPADLRLIEATGLLVDESLLTGESSAVAKAAAVLPLDLALADRTNMAYSGTNVVRGRGRGYVVASGGATEIGAIAREVRNAPDQSTPLQQRVATLTRTLGLATAGVSALVVVAVLITGGTLADAFRLAVSLAVASVPEGLPVAFTITLAIGVRRMARRRAVVRHLGAVETLGSTTVIGSDKTGTLTENRMTVTSVWAGGEMRAVASGRDSTGTPPDPGSPFALTLQAGILASEARPPRRRGEEVADPTEAALLVAATASGIDASAARAAHPALVLLPFEPEHRYAASVHDDEGRRTVFVKGAPDRVLAMCGALLAQSGPIALSAAAVRRATDEMGAAGLRVLAMAYGTLPDGASAEEFAAHPRGLTFLGLQGMRDPLRPGAREAVAACLRAGIRVLMITGDQSETARAIARDLGMLAADAPVVTGSDIERMTDEAFRTRVREASVFARVSPTHKLRIVRALRAQGEVVAITGDGVNDAPALKAADIGVAMGMRGSDVAREAADLVLADDDFTSVYAAVEEGRVAFDNLRRITHFLVSTGVAEVLTILGAIALGLPLILLPVQILWLNLVTEGLQDIALAFEPAEEDVLRRPPRPRGEPILSRLLWERTALAAAVMAAGTLALFGWSLQASGSLAMAQSVALTSMTLFQTFQVGNARSERRSLLRLPVRSNPFLFLATFGALAVHVVALSWTPTQRLLGVTPLPPSTWLAVVLVALAVVAAVEAHKALRRERDGRAETGA